MPAFRQRRDGISIGEGAGFILLEKAAANSAADAVALLGVGERAMPITCRRHIPRVWAQGLAMESALAECRTRPERNRLHQPARHRHPGQRRRWRNKAVVDLFGRQTRCSSTKGWTGHTLGACGAIEAIISALAIANGFLPGSVNTRNVDPAMGLRYLLDNETGSVDRVMSNAFGFGGTNCSLVLGRHMKMKFFVEAVAVLGPGLAGWEAARPILAGSTPYIPCDLVLPRFEALPAAERRRVGPGGEAVVSVGLQALEQAAAAGDAVPTVFTSSVGDGDVINEICSMLAGSDRSSRRRDSTIPYTTPPRVTGGFATGSQCAVHEPVRIRLELYRGPARTATQASVDHESVLLIAYDLPYPEPLRGVRRFAIRSRALC